MDPNGERRGARNYAALLPNLITIGNGICGFVALTLVAGVRLDENGHLIHPEYFKRAAWVILLGMAFDVFDGRVARMTGRTSVLGAQLDSFCDLVTFGLAPAGLMITLHRAEFLETGARVPLGYLFWLFGLAYFLGAMLRLARFNVEHSPDEESHQRFEGLPSPAAAGTVASLVLFYCWLKEWNAMELRSLASEAPEWVTRLHETIPFVLPFVVLVLGFAMVSTWFVYPHIASRLAARRSFDTLVYLIFLLILIAISPELFLPILFLGYVLWTPIAAFVRRLRPSSTHHAPARSHSEAVHERFE